MTIFRQLFDSESSSYTYLLGDQASRKAIIIDPVIEKLNDYLQLCVQLDIELVYAVDTHTHADHITALGKLRSSTGCVTMMGEQSMADCLTEKFADQQIISVGNIELKAIYTPGHTDDSYSFYVKQSGQGKLFTGDTLLIRGTGRTDFQNGNARDQYHSIFSRILKYPDDTLIYPAHDYKGWTVSSVLEERKFNPRLAIDSESKYVELMGSLQLDNPKLMDVAVPANRACGDVNE